MVVRLRLGRGPQVKKTAERDRKAALALAALLTPAALMACVLALWRLCADLGITGPFAIGRGPFSHWQVWVGVAAGTQLAAVSLNRYGRRERRSRAASAK